MSDLTTSAALAYIKRAIELSNESVAQLQHAADTLLGMGGTGAQPERLLCCSPVTGVISNTPNVWGLDWFDATGYAIYYTAGSSPAYHTGADLNRPGYGDSGAAVYAVADGEIVFAGQVNGWQGQVVCIKHVTESEILWTRYAHIRDVTPIGQMQVTVKRGDKIGVIADYGNDGAKQDHLHFDVCRRDLGVYPGDWPGTGLARVKRDYLDPGKWLKEHSQ